MTRREQVLHVLLDFEPRTGGTIRQTGRQARGLRALGVDAQVLTGGGERPATAREEVRDGLPVRRVGGTWAPGTVPGRAAKAALLAALARCLLQRRDQLGAVHVVMDPDLVLACAAAGALSRTVLMWATEGDATAALRPASRSGRAQAALHARVLRRCRHVVLTDAMAAEVEGLGLPAPAVIPVPAPVGFRPPTAEQRAAARARLRLADGAVAVAVVGHLERRKGVARLVEAVADLPRAPVVLLVAGEGRGGAEDTEAELRGLVRERGLGDRVRLLGRVDDVQGLLWSADLLALASEREGMPNVLLEAMACEVACLAPPRAGGEALLGGGAGIVPPDASVPALRDGLVQALDPAVRARCTARADERLRAISLERVLEAYLGVYTALGLRPPS